MGEIFAVFARSSDTYLGHAVAAALGFSLAAGVLSSVVLSISGIAVPALVMEVAQAIGTLALVGPSRRRSRGAAPARAPQRPAPACPAHGAGAVPLAHVHATVERTGILLFVSEAEHHAEVVADSGIAARVPQEAWDAIVDRLTEAAGADRLAEGFASAAREAGLLLAAHFPGRPDDRNEIPDRIVEI